MLKRLVTSIMVFLAFNGLPVMGNDDVPTREYSDTTIVNRKSDDLISRNIFMELGGSSIGIGVGYDQRFTPNSVFGFRTGLSFTSGSWDDAGWFGAYYNEAYTNVDFKGVTLPLEINAIMGKRASKFEIGLGATPCILHRHETKYPAWDPEVYPDGHPQNSETVKDGVRLNIFGTLNIGYRLQRKSGFFLRVGFTFTLSDLKISPLNGLLLFPNLSLGYTIR